MKHIILVAALIALTFSTAFAGERPTKAENDAAIKASRTLLTTKISDLEKNVADHNTQAAQAAATEVQTLMRKGMGLTSIEMNLETREEQKATNVRYLNMEQAAHQYTLLSGDVAANGKQLVEYARAFIKQY